MHLNNYCLHHANTTSTGSLMNHIMTEFITFLYKYIICVFVYHCENIQSKSGGLQIQDNGQKQIKEVYMSNKVLL